MAVTAQQGTFSFGPQTAKGSIATQFYQHRAVDIDLATISGDQLGPMEVGGVPTPTIPFRNGVTAAGGATIAPRLENTMGWLLHGLCGAHSVTGDEDVLGNTVTGMYNHEFTFSTTNESYVPYMSFRKDIPGAAENGSEDLGETFEDCKIINAAFTLPNDGLVTSRVDVLGRGTGTNFESAPTWTYANTQMEEYNSIPIGSVTGGYFKIPDYSATELPIIGGSVVITNAPLAVAQEKIFGSPYMQDITIVSRRLAVDLIVKWEDPDLYRAVLTGSTTGTAWTTTPFVEDLDVFALAADDAILTTPWGIRFQAPSVMYQIAGGVRLAGNQSVALRVTGVALASTSDYFTVNLGNLTTTYTWPT